MAAAVLVNMLVIAQLLIVSIDTGDKSSLDISSSPLIFNEKTTQAAASIMANTVENSTEVATTVAATADPSKVLRRQKQLAALRDEVFLPMTSSFDGMSWWSAVFLSDALIGVPIAIMLLKTITGICRLILRLIRERRYTALLLGLDEEGTEDGQESEEGEELSEMGRPSKRSKETNPLADKKPHPQSIRKYWHSRCVGLPLQHICQMVSVSGRYNFEEDLEPYNPKNAKFWEKLVKEHQETKKLKRSQKKGSSGKVDELGSDPKLTPKATPSAASSTSAATAPSPWWSPYRAIRPFLQRLYSAEERSALADTDRMNSTYDDDLMSAGGNAALPTAAHSHHHPNAQGGQRKSFYSISTLFGRGGAVAERLRLLKKGGSSANTLASNRNSYGSIHDPTASEVTAGTMVFDQQQQQQQSPDSGLYDPATLAAFAERAQKQDGRGETPPDASSEDVDEGNSAARRVPRFSWLLAQVVLWVLCTLASRFIVVGITFWSLGNYKVTCGTVSTAVDEINLCYAHEEAYHLFRHTTVKYSDVRAVLRERLKQVDHQATLSTPLLTEVLPPIEVLRAYETAVWQAHVAEADLDGDDLLDVQQTPEPEEREKEESRKKNAKKSAKKPKGNKTSTARSLPSAKQQLKSRSRLTPDQLAPPLLDPAFIAKNPIISIAYVFQRLADTLTCDERQWVLGGGMRVAADLLSLVVIDGFNRFS